MGASQGGTLVVYIASVRPLFGRKVRCARVHRCKVVADFSVRQAQDSEPVVGHIGDGPLPQGYGPQAGAGRDADAHQAGGSIPTRAGICGLARGGILR